MGLMGPLLTGFQQMMHRTSLQNQPIGDQAAMTVAGITLGTQQSYAFMLSPSQDLRHRLLEIRRSHVISKAAVSIRQRLVWRIELG